jgi:hypothetical protein
MGVSLRHPVRSTFIAATRSSHVDRERLLTALLLALPLALIGLKVFEAVAAGRGGATAAAAGSPSAAGYALRIGLLVLLVGLAWLAYARLGKQRE